MALGLAACEAEDEFPSGPTIFDTLLDVEFNGASGFVSFDNQTGTRSVVGVQYIVHNILPNEPDEEGYVNFRGVSSAVVDFLADPPVRIITPFVYPDGTTNSPDVLPPLKNVNMHLITPGVLWAGRVLCGVLILSSLSWIVWTWKSRNRVSVRFAQPTFLFLLCIGSLSMACTIIPMSLQEPTPKPTLDFACKIIPWLLSMGFTVAFSALFSKLWRINNVSVIFLPGESCVRRLLTMLLLTAPQG
mmetsp:Transcript_30066/g.69357  ORF Transcript_30066/g.69357 Transcript_30066/m.69357 type:complete len:245 (-) Transcript_30066:670-1404(-)